MDAGEALRRYGGPKLSQEQASLFHAARIGDIDQMRFLVEAENADLAVRDAWDSTPLFYASLCGHAEMCRYLLSKARVIKAPYHLPDR